MEDDDKTLRVGAWNDLISDIDTITTTPALTLSESFDLSPDFSKISTGSLKIDHSWSAMGDHWNRGLQVDGDIQVHADHDIRLGEVSLRQTLQDIQQRLNILHPMPELEQEWEELRILGQQYRELEQRILDKQRVWSALKQRSTTDKT